MLTRPRSLTVAGAAQVFHLFPDYPAARYADGHPESIARGRSLTESVYAREADCKHLPRGHQHGSRSAAMTQPVTGAGVFHGERDPQTALFQRQKPATAGSRAL